MALGIQATWVGSANAHIRMDEPIARNVWASQPGNDPIKDGPCGSGANDPRSTDPEKINVFSAGETITVAWRETINHPGHFRISIDMDGQDDFVDKTGPTDIVDPPVLPVLLDGIMDAPGGPGTYSVEVTLPDEPCDNCTLQLIQYMTDSNESYYVCADLVIEAEPSSGDGDGDGDATGGASGTGGAPGSDASSGGDSFVGAGGVQATGGEAAMGATSSGGNTTHSGGSVSNEETTTGDDGAPGSGATDEPKCSLSRAPNPAPQRNYFLLLASAVLLLWGRRRASERRCC